MTHENAIEWAKEQVNSTHFEYGKLNMPELLRGPLGRTIYTFRAFSHNYALMMRELAQQDPAAFGRAVRNVALLGGVVAVPILREAFGIYKRMTGKDPLLDGFEDKDNNLTFNLLRFGLPGLLGVDFSGSVATEFIRELNTAGDIPREFLGAVGGLVFNDIPNAIEHFKRDNYARAAESIAPLAVRNVMSAARQAGGLYTKRGQPVMDPATGQQVRMSETEAMGRSLGFQPKSSSLRYELNQYVRDRISNHKEQTDIFATQFLNAARKGDMSRIQGILQAVEEYNKTARERGEPPINLMPTIERRQRSPAAAPKSWWPFVQRLQ